MIFKQKTYLAQDNEPVHLSCSSTSLSQVNVERRLFSFRFGDPQARMNWVHVDNLVLAHTLAAEALTVKGSCVAVSVAGPPTDSSGHSTLEK